MGIEKDTWFDFLCFEKLTELGWGRTKLFKSYIVEVPPGKALLFSTLLGHMGKEWEAGEPSRQWRFHYYVLPFTKDDNTKVNLHLEQEDTEDEGLVFPDFRAVPFSALLHFLPRSRSHHDDPPFIGTEEFAKRFMASLARK